MKSAEKLKNSMKLGHVYRRQDLENFSTAVDRDLKTLIESGEARKLAWGLYERLQESRDGVALADELERVRAFLKTEDFLLSDHLVYNHKRAGHFFLGGRRYEFRIVRAYPKAPSNDAAPFLGSRTESVVRENMPLHVVSREDERSDLRFWLRKSPEERVAAVEFLREQYYALSGCKSLPRLAHAIRMRPRRA